MSSRQIQYVRKTRKQLIDKLGGVCALCGSRDELEFDHINGRDYEPSKLSSSARLARYKREVAAGEIRLLCNPCNLKARKQGLAGQCVATISFRPPSTHMTF